MSTYEQSGLMKMMPCGHVEVAVLRQSDRVWLIRHGNVVRRVPTLTSRPLTPWLVGLRPLAGMCAQNAALEKSDA